MRTRTKLALSLALAVVAAPVLAGGEQCQKSDAAHASASAKCTMSAEACQKELAAMKKGGWLGLKIDKSESGVLTVEEVVLGSPAEKAGFRAGDVLVAMNGITYGGEENYERIKAAKKDLRPGSSVTYTIERDGRTEDLTATLGKMPESVYQAMLDEHMKEHVTIASTK